MVSSRHGEVMTDALATSAGDLLSYLERRVGVQDAPDLLGELMVVAWRRVAALPAEPEEARMWLFGIARLLVSNANRSEQRRWRLADRLRSLVQPATTPPPDDGAEVRDAVARLDGESAELIRLVHWDGFSIVEAAVILAIPASTARGRYQRAKQQLRDSLSLPSEV